MKIKSKPCRLNVGTTRVVLRQGVSVWMQGLLWLCLLVLIPGGCQSGNDSGENPEEEVAKKEDKKDDQEKPFSWIYSPYEVHVWVAMGPSPRLTVQHRNAIQRRLAERAVGWVGYSWNVESEAAPRELTTDITRNMERLEVETVVAQLRGPEPEKKRKKKTAGKPKETTAEEKSAEEKSATDKPKEVTDKESETAAEEKAATDKSKEATDQGKEATAKPKDKVASTSSLASNPYRHLLAKDKLYLLGVTDEGDSWKVQVRELDLHTRTIGAVFERVVKDPSRLPDEAFDVIAESFHPIARVNESQGKSAELTVRAGGLVQSKESPLYVGSRAVLRPVIRRNNRLGEPLKAGVVEVEWTYIFVDHEKNGQLQCQVWSAMRNPIAGRTSSRTQRFGLLVRPTGRPTELKLVAQGDESHTLKGYDVFAKTPQPIGKDEKLTEEEEPKKLGQSDWRGVIEIDPIKSGVRVVYIKNGQQLLARLPMVPGYYPEQTAILPNDDSRLKVESYVTGIQNSLLDLVIQQKVLEIRIKGKIKQKKFDEANTLLDELRELTSLEDLEVLLQSKEREIFATKLDLRLEKKITQLFQQTRALMAKYLDPELESKLVQEVAKNRGK
ncbi:MAG: hypothetical protein GY917_24505 [Planctomycetaceae bacterium]|nr:hypothetical protein [Planctomycetaceae bacterium]